VNRDYLENEYVRRFYGSCLHVEIYLLLIMQKECRRDTKFVVFGEVPVCIIVTNEVERVLNVADRMVSGIGTFDRCLTQLIHTIQ